MATKRLFLGVAFATAAVAAVDLTVPARAQTLPNIRWGYVLPPITEMAGIFATKPELTKHLNKTYTFEPKFVRGSPLLVTALAANEVEVANLGFSTLNQAVVNAGLKDLRIITDEAEDGINGYFASETRVNKDSGIDKVEDLKGKVVATIAIGSAADMSTKNMLRKRGLEANRDYTILETPFATMKQMLLEKKVDSAYFAQPFASDPEVNEKTKVLFTTADSMGIMMANFVVGRGAFMEKNRAAMVDFLEDYLRVVRWYFDQANRKEAIELVSQANKLPVAVLDKYLFTKKDNYRDMDGLPDLKAIQSNMQVQYDLGFTKTLINAEEYSDLSLVKEAAARLK